MGRDYNQEPTGTQIALKNEIQPPRLPMPDQIVKLGYSVDQWKALTDAIFPAAETVDGVAMAIMYCRQRGLDVFKRPVHVVPMYNAALRRSVDTVWPGIGELRTTAGRTRSWAGIDECKFGPTLHLPFRDERSFEARNGKSAYVDKLDCRPFDFPEWAQVTVYKIVAGVRCEFVGPKVFFRETFSGQKGLRVPNTRWQQSPWQMLEKCAEAAALRRAFPEEIGNEYTAEEMEGGVLHVARERIAGGQTKETTIDVSANVSKTLPKREDFDGGDDDDGWDPEIDEDLAWLQESIDLTHNAEALEATKLKSLAQRPGWPEAARADLAKRFDDRIAKLNKESGSAGGETDGEAGAEVSEQEPAEEEQK